MKNVVIGISLVLGIIPFMFAQQPVIPVKGSYVDSLNRYYQQAALPIYISISHEPQGDAHTLAPLGESSPQKIEPIFVEGHGKHFLKHKDIQEGTDEQYVIYADARAPISKKALTGMLNTSANGQKFYGKDLKFSVSAYDDMTGVKEVYYSVNKEKFSSYKDSLLLNKEGEFLLQYYAVDKVGNMETIQRDSFIVDLSAPISNHRIVGASSEENISLSTQIYLTNSDALSGVGETKYHFDDEDWKKYAGGLVSFSHLEEGNHTLYYYAIDKVNNQEEIKSLKFFLDKSAPIMSASILGDKFLVEDKVYFSGRSKLKLIAVDNKSGVKDLKYSIDGQEFVSYEQPFYLPDEAGLHRIKYYAEDMLGNTGVGGEKNEKYGEIFHNIGQVYVDLNGPVLGFKYLGPQFTKGDSIFIHPDTEINLFGTDGESGLSYLSYLLDGEKEEVTFEENLKIATPGHHKLDFYGYDNVNNRNISSMSFVVDNLGPEIQETFSTTPKVDTDKTLIVPSYTILYISAVDKHIGTEDIYFSLNGAPKKLYNKPIEGLKKDTEYEIAITATDKLGNKQDKLIRFRTEDY